MPRPRRQTQQQVATAQANNVNVLSQYVKLENRLVLLAWLNSLLGFEHNRDLLADMKEAAEGFDASGRSHIYHRLISHGDRVKISPDVLVRYEDNIREHLTEMNRRRPEPVTLRYFQYLAALYTEIFLDYYFNHRAAMLIDLNAFVAQRNAARLPVDPQDEKFTEEDIKKLVFWMATGSGKTLIMHFNYRQFLHYNRNGKELDNILLVTPNEGLSEQHLEELAASGIPAKRFDLNESGLRLAVPNTVRVIEITKLVEEKRGGGVSVPVEAFEGNNLIFVDEGHKGSGGEVWRKYRDDLGKTGFTFEYSATFGQALSAVRNDELTSEYGKAIAFDYSYRYFHGDGYGKDFNVLNLTQETTEQQTELLLLGNLLSFYEQHLLFEKQADSLRPYNLERPLWVFVGHTVKGTSKDDKTTSSDVLTVARFLHHVLENRRGWVEKGLEKLLDSNTGLQTDGVDVFNDKFPYLRERKITAQKAYAEILKKVLHAPAAGGLHLCEIRRGSGEIGLKAAGSQEYFGLIYIGDTNEFKKLVDVDASGIVLEEDAITDSLFESIGQSDTNIEILIGAKKFMEGWNSWRVSTMGLLNIGRQEGSQIIQLFGRGVRLRGKQMSLKRSSAISGTHPPYIKLLETLNIFAVRADYMSTFRNHLEREGVETEELVELPLFVQANKQFLKKGLLVPRLPENSTFDSIKTLVLAPDKAVQARVDMSMKVQTVQSIRDGVAAAVGQSGHEQTIPDESLKLVDWEKVYLNLLEYKENRGWKNLVIPHDVPAQIITHSTDKGMRLYRLITDEDVIKPKSFGGRLRLQEAVVNILRTYTEKFYQLRREQWESQQMVYRPLDANDPNLAFNRQAVKEKKALYVVRVPRSRSTLISSIQKLIADAKKLYKEENDNLPRIYFDRHIYLPLLLHKDENSPGATPPPLNDSETQFVKDLKAYWIAEKETSLQGKEVFLLRNLSKGKGISFFEERKFYPDFILWIVEKKNQRIVFIEPHGMVFAKAYVHDEKAHLHETLPLLAKDIATRSKKHKQVILDSYIISATPFDKLYKSYDDGTWDRQKFRNAHILFPEINADYNYINEIIGQ